MKRHTYDLRSAGKRAAAGVVVTLAIAVGGAGVAQAQEGTAYVLADAQCSPEVQGVLDITLVNDSDAAVTFVITEAGEVSPSTFMVAPLSAHAVTYTGLPDGRAVVPITLDGVDATAVATVACGSTQVQSLATTQFDAEGTDDAGGLLPATGSSTGGLVIGGAMVLAGIATSLLSRRRVS